MALERRRDELGGGQGDDGPTLGDQLSAQVARAIREREARDRAARERAAQDRAPRDDQDTAAGTQDTAAGPPPGAARPDTAAAISLSSLTTFGTTFGRPARAADDSAADDGDDDATSRGDSGRHNR